MLRFGIRQRLRRLGLYPQIPAQTGLKPLLSRVVWLFWSFGCRRGPISQTGVATRALSPHWAERFLAELDSAPPTTIQVADRAAGYVSEDRPQELAYLNRVNDYREVTPGCLKALEEFLVEHRAEIDRLFGHKWRVSSVRPFYLRPFGQPGGRHTDGWPMAIRKLFILPRGATEKTGTTWFELIGGRELLVNEPQPTWMIFENSRVLHALVPGEMPRPTIELNIVPARQTSTRPHYAGLNGWYPLFPWN